MLRDFLKPFVVFEVSDPTGGGGAVTAEPGVQADSAQGTQPAPGQFNWGLFPNVPEEQREVLEPHLRTVQAHVTQLEQQLAPFKAFADSGLTPEATQGLLRFSADFDSDPRGMWLRLGNMLQESGEVDPDVDLEYLAAIAAGEDPDAGQPSVEQNGNGAVPPGTPNPNDPVMQQIEALQAQVQEMRQQGEQERARRTEMMQDQLLDRRMSAMREELKGAGWPEDILTDQALTARIVTHRGNIAEATQAMVQERVGLLKGVTDTRQGDEDLDLTNVPPTPQQRQKPGNSWDRANDRATQRLRQNNRGSQS
jgi:hypothetical protein